MKYKVTAFDLKLALLQYYRFKRGCIIIDEFQGADVIVDTGKEIIEVETKITKNDLINGEKKKHRKHDNYLKQYSRWSKSPNKFLFCVPSKLANAALLFVAEINPKYGVIEFDTDRFLRCGLESTYYQHGDFLVMRRSAKAMHDDYSEKTKFAIAKRCSSKLCKMQSDLFKQKVQESKNV